MVAVIHNTGLHMSTCCTCRLTEWMSPCAHAWLTSRLRLQCWCYTAGQEGRKALERSKQLVQPLRAAVALPFLGLILFTRILTPLKGRLLAALPMRYYRELPEIPIALYFGFTVLAVIIHR